MIPIQIELETAFVGPRSFRVALVAMPFYSAVRPSIQLGLLASECRAAGYETQTFHMNVELAARLTPELYEPLCGTRGRMTGDWLFSFSAFGAGNCASCDDYFAAFPGEFERLIQFGCTLDQLKSWHTEYFPQFIRDCVERVPWRQFDIVGFSSTFQQTVASLALAKAIKKEHPSVKIVFGGANTEDEMGLELLKAFEEIDYVVVGEGDVALPALLSAVAQGREPKDVSGVASRSAPGEISFSGPACPVKNLDGLPVPDYSEYFQTLEKTGLSENSQYAWCLPFETSRGCWWGEKHHCTFCGLNGSGMGFRVKTPDRVMLELNELSTRHRITFFEATDNILDHRYIPSMFKSIEDAKLDYRFFFEVKSNLRYDQIQRLYRGGVKWVQPGIESLSTRILGLMKKGTKLLQNVLFLKWCRYYRIRVSWNLLWGFPGETQADYDNEFEVMKLLSHFEPPGGCGRIWMERFSPIYMQRGDFKVTKMLPEPSYSYVYPAHVDLAKIAYFFSYEMQDTLPESAHDATRQLVANWNARWKSNVPDSLTYRKTANGIFIDERREGFQRGCHSFTGPVAVMYEVCSEKPQTVSDVTKIASQASLVSETDARKVLSMFCDLGLMIQEDSRFLSLAIPDNPNL